MMNHEQITKIILIANLVYDGLGDVEYQKLSKEDKALVDCFVEARKMRLQLDYNNTFKNKSTYGSKFF